MPPILSSWSANRNLSPTGPPFRSVSCLRVTCQLADRNSALAATLRASATVGIPVILKTAS